MTTTRIRTPGRLHFGLLARGPAAPRQFGGLGLMVDRPGIVLEAEPAGSWSASGFLAERARGVAERVAGAMASSFGVGPRPLSFRVVEAPPEHVGLGVGTQLGLAVAKLIATSAGLDLDAPSLAAMAGRGARSGVGLHGFDRGGLIVDGGHRGAGGVAPMVARPEFPAEWSVLVATRSRPRGLSGPDEIGAFARLPPIPESETDRLCRLVLLGILPSVAERDLEGFGAALEEIQHRVGSWFAPAQGGLFAGEDVAELAAWLKEGGLVGVGQSSWGPTLYGFTAEGPEWQEAFLRRLRERFGAMDLLGWTAASPRGAILT